MDYKKQAEDFLRSCNVSYTAEKAIPQLSPRWAKDGKHGMQYSITLAKIDTQNPQFLTPEELRKMATKYIQFSFWDSIANKEKAEHGNHKKPTAYDVLAGIYHSETDNFEDFCSNYGYSNDSIEALKTWEEVKELNAKLESIFTAEELEKLNEIQ